jgi:trk system potassium uptake protein TrkA
MRIVIGGAGRVGTEMARALRAEDMDVILVDSDSRAVKNAQNLDVLVIHGDLTTREKLYEAGIGEAEVFVATTNSDERNLLACTLAKHAHNELSSSKSKTLLTICRVRDMNFVREQDAGKLKEWAKVDYVVNPLEGAIRRLHSGLRSSAIEEVIPFGQDAFVIELDVTNKASDIVFQCLRDASKKIEGGMPLIVGLKRDGEKSLVPDGDFMLMPNDRIAIATTGLSSFNRILNIFGHEATDFPTEPRVAVIGANRIGQRIADDWLEAGASVTVIERDLQLANMLSGTETGSHPKLEVIHGDHLDRDILTEIGISEHHMAIAALEDDLASIAAALLASDMGVQTTGLLLYDADLVKVTQRMGITFAVDRKRVAVDNMLAQIHTKTVGGYAILSNIPNIIGVSMLVSSESGFAGKRVLEASFPDWMRIAFIQRLNTNGTWESLRPSLDKTLLEDDRLIIFCSPERVVELEKRFKV